MIVGSGMIAHAFRPLVELDESVCVYAYGVSNSQCVDSGMFLREELALSQAIQQQKHAAFVYFGTCSVDDPEMQQSPYVLHKQRMEVMVGGHRRSLIVRLPQVAGFTRNPYTLLNFLANHIVNGTPFNLWVNAWRNIIDVADVVSTVMEMLSDTKFINRVVNVANSESYSMLDIVSTMERVLERDAVYQTLERGSLYRIDVTEAKVFMDAAGVTFGKDYLERLIKRYQVNF